GPTAWTALASSSATQISPPWGPKPGGTTAGPSISRPKGPAISVAVPAPLTLKTLPSRQVTIMSLPNVPKWSNVIPLWSVEVHPVSVANSVTACVLASILKTVSPSVTKTSRGVNPAFADIDGAIAMYFSRHEPNPGSVANNVAFPLQST